jgi:hypothetical protein
VAGSISIAPKFNRDEHEAQATARIEIILAEQSKRDWFFRNEGFESCTRSF